MANQESGSVHPLVAAGEMMVVPGVYDVLSAKLAERAEFPAVVLTGYGVAATFLGEPDFGLLTQSEILDTARRVTAAVSIGVIVDGDTGYGGPLNVQRMVRELVAMGARGVLLEDQVWPKRCGHMRGKEVVPVEEHAAKIRAAVDARGDASFVLTARTDALETHGIDEAIRRARLYKEAGANLLFVEGPRTLDELRRIGSELPPPLVVNLIEGGRTPLCTLEELQEMGFFSVGFVLSGLYASARALEETYRHIRATASSRGLEDRMFSFDEFNALIGVEERKERPRYRCRDFGVQNPYNPTSFLTEHRWQRILVSPDDPTRPDDFIRSIIRTDLEANKHGGRVVTRFPPEPNGYLHIGHTKAICLNFSIAEEFEGGVFHLRFDDTNPSAEEAMYVEAQERDLRWLGIDWGEHLYFASDYFEQLYQFALQLIERGKAFVCDLSSDEILERRGTLTTPGIESPYRTRSPAKNLDLFRRMRSGEFEPGARTLRAKIDMASPVLPMRDPILYRIVAAPHHRTGDAWPIYPMYDFAHSLSDAIERITHSLCTLEFADRRPLYDWILEQVEAPPPRPQQIEFARLNLSHTVMSKRRLRKLVEDGHVAGWDDPRMPTLSGLRRRGYTPRSIRSFSQGVGVARRENVIQLARLEHSIREDLNRRAPRVMAVLRPLRVVIENYPEDQAEELPAVNNPEDPGMGTRNVPFSRVLYIERDDFLEDPPRKFFRLAPGREVRLRYAYFITCREIVKDEESGEIVELRCTYDPATRGGDAPDGRKVRGTLHWVSATHSLEAEARLYDVLFTREDPDDVGEGEDLTACLNPRSLEVLSGCRVEPSLATASPGDHYQFERLGYFCVDPDSTAAALVFNRTVTLRDTWAKIAKKSKDSPEEPR